MATGNGVTGLCCFAGHVAEGKPKGTYQDLGGVRTYIAIPEVGILAECAYGVRWLVGHG
jgi:hypothetical protein